MLKDKQHTKRYLQHGKQRYFIENIKGIPADK